MANTEIEQVQSVLEAIKAQEADRANQACRQAFCAALSVHGRRCGRAQAIHHWFYP
jgi:DNA-binding GntR family transcriptional regulator